MMKWTPLLLVFFGVAGCGVRSAPVEEKAPLPAVSQAVPRIEGVDVRWLEAQRRTISDCLSLLKEAEGSDIPPLAEITQEAIRSRKDTIDLLGWLKNEHINRLNKLGEPRMKVLNESADMIRDGQIDKLRLDQLKFVYQNGAPDLRKAIRDNGDKRNSSLWTINIGDPEWHLALAEARNDVLDRHHKLAKDARQIGGRCEQARQDLETIAAQLDRKIAEQKSTEANDKANAH